MKIGYCFRKQSGSKNEVIIEMTLTKNILQSWYYSMRWKKNQKESNDFWHWNWLWKSDLGSFWQVIWTSVKVKSKNYFAFTDFFLLKSSLSWLTSTKLHHWSHTKQWYFGNKIVLTYCEKKFVLVISKFLQILGLQPRISIFFLNH